MFLKKIFFRVYQGAARVHYMYVNIHIYGVIKKTA